MQVAQLYIYPVKGLRGVSVQEARVGIRGLVGDRRYMLVGEDNYFLSQRSHPQLALYSAAFQDGGNLLVSLSDKQLTISPSDVTEKQIIAGMFEHELPVHVLSRRINDWWSQQLGEPVRMVYQAPTDVRIKEYIGDGDRTEVSLADGYPILTVGTASLTYLNTKLDTPVAIDRFRPNIVWETSEPHIEDETGHIQVGSAALYTVKPCARCQVVTIDQQSAAISKEPLKTLSTYRKVGNKVNFGANAVATKTGVIRVGDEVVG